MRSPSKLVAGVVAAALLTGSPLTAAAAQTAVSAAPAQNGWAALSMLTPVGATALGQSAAAVAQPAPPPPPGPPPPSNVDTGMPPPPIAVLVVLAAWLATLIYIGTKNNGHGAPNSPA